MPEWIDKKKEATGNASEAAPSTPMFSKKGMIVLLVALVIEGLVASLLFGAMGTGAAGEGEDGNDDARVKLLNIVKVEIAGPSVSVSDGLGDSRGFNVKTIRIYIDSELSENDQEILKKNIEIRESEIRSKLASFIRQQSIGDLTNQIMIHEMLADKLKPEIIKLLDVTDREIKEVQISNMDY